MKIAPTLLSLSIAVLLGAISTTPGWAAWPLESDCKNPKKLLADYNRWAGLTRQQCIDSTRGVAGGGSSRLSCCRNFEEQWYSTVARVCTGPKADPGMPMTKLIPEASRKGWVTECNK
ncbi:MAG: hypothetical protein H7836_04915 [Magnetococcus sp. YQC-3]